jgi:LmbE family N-acetylglucosaminyl deacetylase
VNRARATSTAMGAVALALLGAACGNDDSPASTFAAPPAVMVAAPVSVVPTGAHEVFVVAHQDDDLLFMNPDIARCVLDPAPTLTVYLTAGDAGHADDTYYLEREQGVLAAYASLANVADPHWATQRLALNGHDVLVRRLAEVDASIVFMRLPDGNGDGAGFKTLHRAKGQTLAKLWDRSIPTLSAIDGSATYDHDELVDALAALFAMFGATHINALDATNAFGFDHSDHIHAGLFTQEAAPPTANVRLYRGYNIRAEGENLAPDEAQAKWDAFSKYMLHDAAICPEGTCDAKIVAGYQAYAARQYVITAEPGSVGPVANARGDCLDVVGGSIASTTCSEASSSQRFTVTSDGHVLASDHRCLVASSAGPELSPCVAGLDPDPGRWSLMSGGNLVNVSGSCLAADNAALSLGACDRRPASQWTVRFAPEKPRSHLDGLIAPRAVLADVDGDGHADLCARTPEGIECAMASASGDFRSPVLVTAQLDNPSVWIDPERDASIHAVDIDRDGKIDLCVLASDGARCARGVGRGAFAPATKISYAADFLGADAGSFTMGDVDGDGFPDACARENGDVRCARGDHLGRLLRATVWLPARAMANMPETAGARWILADITGRGDAGICRVGAHGIVCATSHRRRQVFERPRRWLIVNDAMFQSDTVVFGDVDGDHAADFCALSGTNVVCGSSTGSTFSAPLVRVAGAPEDPTWTNGHLVLGDLDGNRRVDACRWSDVGVTCANAP